MLLKQLSECVSKELSITLAITDHKDGKKVVTVHPKGKQEWPPFTIIGTPDELDEAINGKLNEVLLPALNLISNADGYLDTIKAKVGESKPATTTGTTATPTPAPEKKDPPKTGGSKKKSPAKKVTAPAAGSNDVDEDEEEETAADNAGEDENSTTGESSDANTGTISEDENKDKETEKEEVKEEVKSEPAPAPEKPAVVTPAPVVAQSTNPAINESDNEEGSLSLFD